jgi:hypothetical protein
MEDSIQLLAPLELKPSGDNKLPSKFAGTAYSGGKAAHYENLVIDLSSTRVADDMPLLFQHQHDKTIGFIEKTVNDGQRLTVSGALFSDIDKQAEKIAKKARAGLKYQMSVGLYDVSAERVPEGKDITVNGQTFAGPITVLRNGTVREVSIVALGADPKTSATMFKAHDHRQPKPKEGEMPDELKKQLEQLQANNARLKTELKAEQDNAGNLQSELDKLRNEQRLSEVKSLFEKTGREFSEEAAKPYMDMTSELFSSVSRDMLALAKPGDEEKPDAPDALFRDLALDGKPGENNQKPQAANLNAADIYAKRREAV